MRLGVECLLTDDPRLARHYAEQLSAINQERRDLQASMVAEADVLVATAAHSDATGVALYEPSWHAGVVGLCDPSVKELHQPAGELGLHELAVEDALSATTGRAR